MKDTTKKINSVASYLQAIADMTAKPDNDETKRLFWFRGESSDKFNTNLVPSSYRVLVKNLINRKDDLLKSNHVKQLEININEEFYRRGLPYIKMKGIENTSWNRYYLMQHYKINTRLLDWTENALIALFFAISDLPTINDDAIVWVLEPYLLNQFTIKTILDNGQTRSIIPHGADYEKPQDLVNEKGELIIEELTRRYLKMDFKEINEEEKPDIYYPLAIYPPNLDERMSSQKACFTVFGNKINGLLSVKSVDNFINSVTIEGGLTKTKMLNELKLLGFDYEYIFPNLDGLGIAIMDKYRNEFNNYDETLKQVLKSFGK